MWWPSVAAQPVGHLSGGVDHGDVGWGLDVLLVDIDGQPGLLCADRGGRNLCAYRLLDRSLGDGVDEAAQLRFGYEVFGFPGLTGHQQGRLVDDATLGPELDPERAQH